MKVYVVADPAAISFLIDDDLHGFQEYLNSEEMLEFGKAEEFSTEEEAQAFCRGLGYGSDDGVVPTCYPLRSFEPSDVPFIEAIDAH